MPRCWLPHSSSLCSQTPFYGVFVMQLALLSLQPPGSHQSLVSAAPSTADPSPQGAFGIILLFLLYLRPSFLLLLCSFLILFLTTPCKYSIFSFFSPQSLLWTYSHIHGIRFGPLVKAFAGPNFKSSCCAPRPICDFMLIISIGSTPGVSFSVSFKTELYSGRLGGLVG